MNAGLVLLAPSAPTMRQEYSLMIALEVDIWTFMPITATAEPGVDSSTVKMQSSRISLADHRRYTDGYQTSRPQVVEQDGFITLGGC